MRAIWIKSRERHWPLNIQEIDLDDSFHIELTFLPISISPPPISFFLCHPVILKKKHPWQREGSIHPSGHCFSPLRSRSSLTPFWFPVFIFENVKKNWMYIYLICNVSSRCKTPLGKRIPSCLFVVWKTVRHDYSALIYSSSSVCFFFIITFLSCWCFLVHTPSRHYRFYSNEFFLSLFC